MRDPIPLPHGRHVHVHVPRFICVGRLSSLSTPRRPCSLLLSHRVFLFSGSFLPVPVMAYDLPIRTPSMSCPPPFVSASLLAADLAALGEEARLALSAGADWLHLDIMVRFWLITYIYCLLFPCTLCFLLGVCLSRSVGNCLLVFCSAALQHL